MTRQSQRPACRDYKNVHVILMTWENSENSNDMDIWSETVLLRHIFEEGYNFQVDSYKIPFKDPIRKVQERLNQYERQFSSPDNLLIVYYGGHGGSSQGMGLYLGPSENTLPKAGSIDPLLPWSVIQVKLERNSSDILVFLDCCNAAASVLSAQRANPRLRGKFEVIASSACPGETEGFAKQLIHVLRYHAGKRSDAEPYFLTAAGLFSYLLEYIAEENLAMTSVDLTAKPSCPIHFFLPGARATLSISLKPLGLNPPTGQQSSHPPTTSVNGPPRLNASGDQSR